MTYESWRISFQSSEQAALAAYAEAAALRAEVERWKIAGREWLDKTEWVQQTIKPRELGHHRADILRERIQRSEARAERLAEDVDALRGVLGRILENEASDYKSAEEFGGYVLDDELREEARAALAKEGCE